LVQVLQPIREVYQGLDVPDLLIGLDSPDDAAVWRLGDGRALVMTTDFFTPVVDDPYDYGAISAANSLSDIYAMGGTPFAALSIAALPPNLDISLSQRMMQGLAEKTLESGTVIVGGHTIDDKEPKIGLVVLGFAEEDHLIRKDGLQLGDQLVLTKPLGFGVTTTALKRQEAPPEDIQEAVDWMKQLNRGAAQLATQFAVKAGTDITGFSLLGHAWEMALGAGVGLKLNYQDIPLISCAHKHAQAWRFPGGAFDNQTYYQSNVVFDPGITEAQQLLLFDPQTSGGLLLGVPTSKIDAFMKAAQDQHQPAWVIGEVIQEPKIKVKNNKH
jgi:selenide,water dikinase